MVLVPFVYFTLLTFYWWHKHRCFDVCVYMSALYAFTSFCAVMIVCFNLLEGGGLLFDGFEAELNLVPTLLYCFLLTLTMAPFALFYRSEIEEIENRSPFIVDCVSWMLIAQSFLNLYLVAGSTMEILSGDLSLVRNSHYAGDASLADLKAMTLPSIFQYYNYLNYCTILALPLFFYNACVAKRAWWFSALLLFASLSSPLKGIQTADRTEFIYYAEMFLLCLVFFKKYLTKGVKMLFYILGAPVVAMMLLYLTVVSSDRFEKTDAGTTGSVLQYAGQGYLNFCYFYENAKSDYIYVEREFPIITHVVLKKDYSDMKDERSAQQGFFIGVFATFIGAVLLDVGFIGVIIWCLFYAFMALFVLKYYNRTKFDISDILCLFVLASVPVFGVFYYRFYSFYIAIEILFVLFLFVMSKYKFKFR